MQAKDILLSIDKKLLRWPGIEPGTTAWKAAMLTIIPPSLDILEVIYINIKTIAFMMSSHNGQSSSMMSFRGQCYKTFLSLLR